MCRTGLYAWWHARKAPAVVSYSSISCGSSSLTLLPSILLARQCGVRPNSPWLSATGKPTLALVLLLWRVNVGWISCHCTASATILSFAVGSILSHRFVGSWPLLGQLGLWKKPPSLGAMTSRVSVM